MERHSELCVRQAWDEAQEAQEASAQLLVNSLSSGPLPLYPELGQLSWDSQDFDLPGLCGLLHHYCPRHGPRSGAGGGGAPSRQPWPQGAETETETGEQPEAPSDGASPSAPPCSDDVARIGIADRGEDS